MTDSTTAQAMVTRALTSHGVSREVIAAEFGVSGRLISCIRVGELHRTIRPDLPRWRHCYQCVHCEQARCTLGFPDQVAIDCPAFARAGP